MKSQPNPEEVARRLRLLRLALGYKDQVALVSFLGAPVTTQHWNNWERARNLPTVGLARHVSMKTRVTVDWIYWGERAGLPLQVVQLLDQTESQAASRA